MDEMEQVEVSLHVDREEPVNDKTDDKDVSISTNQLSISY